LFTSLTDVGRIQKRMHNKLFIADNAWGITGGRNLGDAYFGRGEDSNFVDLDILAVGRVVRDMSASFDSYWNNELAYPVETLLDRGVRIRVLTNSLASNDAPAAHAGYARYRDRLMALGIELHEMRSEQDGSPGLGSGVGSISTGSGPGGSKSAVSRASLHSKA